MANTNYPDGQSTNPVPLDNPSIEKCVLTSTRIIDPITDDFICDSNGEPQVYDSQVMVKEGSTSTFDHQFQIRSSSPTVSASYDSGSDTDSDSDDSITSDSDEDAESPPRPERGYHYVPNEDTKICGAIYGGVFRAKVLERTDSNADWRLTKEECAVKAMKWEDIIREAQRVPRKMENVRTEIAAMTLLIDCYDAHQQGGNGGLRNASAADVREAMRVTNIVMALDFLYDNVYLYIIMPYCDGGELFDHQGSFTEEICQTEVFPQMLNGLTWLQNARICHRDLSLENFVVDGEGERRRLIIIDLGMALRIPYSGDTRQLISPQPRCGKEPYVSPEVYRQESIDGHAVDLWAVGIVLFILLIGDHPWQSQLPRHDNRQYLLMSGGHLAQMCTRYLNIIPSELSLNLMENMLRADVRRRLSLQQIRMHGWLNET